MPLQSVQLAPGVNTALTPVLGMAQIIKSQCIRFALVGAPATYGGAPHVLPQKLGGWAKYYPVSLGSACRALHAWEGINNDIHLAAGCTASLNVITSGNGTDITPRTATTNPAVSFTTTNGSTTVSIDDPGFSTAIYDSIFLVTPVSIGGIVLYGSYQISTVIDADTYQIQSATPATAPVGPAGAVPSFATVITSPEVTVTLNDHPYLVGEIFAAGVPTTVGGITISGAYLVQTVPSANTFTIVGATAATATTSGSMNGGLANIIYFVSTAPSPTTSGYGTGTYGTGGYGVGTTPSPSTGTPITATNWTLDNWGEILLSCPTGGTVYQWSPDSGFGNAAKVVGAPLKNGGIFISQPAQILVCWASSFDDLTDPLQVNWSDAGDFTNFTVSSRTQAGGQRIPTGSKIMGGISGPNFSIIWTDVDCWAMDYIEPPLVFGFNSIASNCGLVGRHAMGTLNDTVYWMGATGSSGTPGYGGQFFRLDGESVQVIPCPVWDQVFQNMDLTNLDKVTCATNSLYGEVTWFYPSLSGGGEVDSYVKMNTLIPNCWDYGTLQRTAWTDTSPVGQPVGGDASGNLFQHEISNDADGQPLNAWLETGYWALQDGDDLTFVDWLIPDFRYGAISGSPGAILQLSFGVVDYPSANVLNTLGPYSVSNVTDYVNTRFRGRFAKMRIESNDLGSFWRLGGVKLRSAPSGKR